MGIREWKVGLGGKWKAYIVLFTFLYLLFYFLSLAVRGIVCL